MADANRTKALLLRLTEEEATQLKEQSDRTGRSMSDIIRSAWKKLKIIELSPADFAETVVQLRRIGNNLNNLPDWQTRVRLRSRRSKRCLPKSPYSTER